MGTATLTAPITDEGMRMTPGELTEEFYERLADLNTDMRTPPHLSGAEAGCHHGRPAVAQGLGGRGIRRQETFQKE